MGVTMGTLMVTDHTITEREALMLMLMPMLMPTITVIPLMVWVLFTVMVTTHMHPVTMVTTWASVALKNNLDLMLNLMPMVTIPAITVDGDMVDTVDTADITGAKLTDQTTSLFFLTDFFPDSINKIQKLINSSKSYTR